MDNTESKIKITEDKTKPSPATVVENGVTVRLSDDKFSAGKHNPRPKAKLLVFREFALASAQIFSEEHGELSARSTASGEAKRQFYACDLVSQSGLAGLQWKKHLGGQVHVTLVEQKLEQSQMLHDNSQANGFIASPLPLQLSRPAGGGLVAQAEKEVHVARCDPSVLLQLEAFDFVYLDPHKNPSPFFNTLFRSLRNKGTVCVVVPDTMHFARSPHVVRRCYGASCEKTEYLKELAVRIILAALAVEAAKCHKGIQVMYSLSLEDFLLLCVRVERGSKHADEALMKIGTIIHCRICGERAFFSPVSTPIEDPYGLLSCDCQKNVPGKTGIVLGPLWKGRIFDYKHLTKVAAAGRRLHLSHAFFVLLQRAMEECLCDEPPSLQFLQEGPESSGSSKSSSDTQQAQQKPPDTAVPLPVARDDVSGSSLVADDDVSASLPVDVDVSGKGDAPENVVSNITLNGSAINQSQENMDMVENPSDHSTVNGSLHAGKPQLNNQTAKDITADVSSPHEADSRLPDNSFASAGPETSDKLDSDSAAALAPDTSCSVVRQLAPAEPAGVESPCLLAPGDRCSVKRRACGTEADTLSKKSRLDKTDDEPAPAFYYNIHSKRLGKGRLPKQHVIVQCLRGHGYRCSRTHFEKYAIRTNANLKTLTSLLGSTESKVPFVRGEDAN